jgi:hypothetical protein
LKKLLILTSLFLAGPCFCKPTIDSLLFEYVENLDPGEVFPCAHEKASVGLFEWDVVCKIRNKELRFFVHLAVQEYQKTKFGKNAYEILYWVTHRDSPLPHRYSSTSIWIHNSEEMNRMNRFVSSLGIEEDNASLRLTLKLQTPSKKL